MTKPNIPSVGISTKRTDARAKVLGAEKYAADFFKDDLLWAGVKRAGVAHGRIKSINIEAALKLPGVTAVLTAKDISGTNRQGLMHKDHPVLADDKVRHCGDAVALVLAENREVLQEAVSLIGVDYEPLPGVFDIDAALASDAPVIHGENKTGNLLLKARVGSGDISEAWPLCDVIVEETFSVPAQCHAFIETENGVAWQRPDGKLEMVVSTQAPFRDRMEISHALAIAVEDIRIKGPCPGGAFGGKDGATVQCLLALAAIHANGRPVKMWWSREESFVAGYKRHAARMHYRLGARASGELCALECRLYYDTGAYAHLGPEVMALGMEHAGGPYRIDHTQIDGWCVYTNNPIGGAMRGFGVVQVSFAFERMMDLLAARLEMDPMELRIKNALQRGDINCAGVVATQSTGVRPCLEEIRNHPFWKGACQWKALAGPFKKRGVGLAAVFNAIGYGRGLPDSAIAKVELTDKGLIRIYNAVSEMGQGNTTAFVQIAGQILCQKDTCMEVIQPDTNLALPSGSATAGRTTYTYGNALIRACKTLREKIIGWAALVLFADSPGDLELLPGRIRHLGSGKEIFLSQLAGFMNPQERICTSQFIMPVVRQSIDTGQEFAIGFPHLLFSHAAHLALVEVDELTGAVEVKKYLAATEAGQILNPQTFDQQVQGAIAQGIGYALSEQLIVDKGRILNPDFTGYILPTAADIPEMVSLHVQAFEPSGPYGMKGVGEVGANGPLPAIANAVADACAINPTASPLTPEYVLGCLWQETKPMKGNLN